MKEMLMKMKQQKKKKKKKKKIAVDGSQIWVLLPEEVIIDHILLNLPVKSLLTLRCVSKFFRSLISSSKFIKLHYSQIHDDFQFLISTRKFDYYLYEDREFWGVKDFIQKYICNFSAATDDHDPFSPEIVEMNCPFEPTDIRASCNGLLYLHGRQICTMKSTTTRIMKSPSYIWNPCTKEYRELPPPPLSALLSGIKKGIHFDDEVGNFIHFQVSMCNAGFCGFGYDTTNEEYKILYYEHLVVDVDPYSIGYIDEPYSPATEFKVYTLGTNTWKSINGEANPYRSLLYFGHQWLRIGLFVSGALHWIMSSDMSSRCATKAKIISFDIEKEEFRELQKPPLHEENSYNHYGNLQVLQGCLCICRFPLPESNNRVDIWMLMDYNVKDSWNKLFRVAVPYFGNPGLLSEHCFKLLGICKNGEIVIRWHSRVLIVYDQINHKARRAQKFEEAVKKYWNYQMDYTESLVSLHSGTYSTAIPIIKAQVSMYSISCYN